MSDFNDCCEGEAIATPVLISNCLGLSAIAYRVGTHSRFKETMLARLSSTKFKTLRSLGTRQDDDFAIALLDSWALVADILTFYNERIANESYLRTSTERLSAIELGRLIGYTLNPGVSAATYLVFDLNDAPGSPQTVVIEAGVKVQSVPEPEEQPQTFETSETITARPAWNAIKPRLTDKVLPSTSAASLYFQGSQTNLHTGDGIYYVSASDVHCFGIVTSVRVITRSSADEFTEVKVKTVPTMRLSNAATFPSSEIQLGGSAKQYDGRTISEDLFQNDSLVKGFEIDDVLANFMAVRDQPHYALVFRRRAAIFGHNAPPWSKLPAALRIAETYYEPSTPNSSVLVPRRSTGIYSGESGKWNDQPLSRFGTGVESSNIYLDSTYLGISTGSFVVVCDNSSWALLSVNDNVELTKSEFTITNKVSRITPGRTDSLSFFRIKSTTVFGESAWLPLARTSETTDVVGNAIDLNNWYTGLRVGQGVFIKGESKNERGVTVSEFATIDEISHDFNEDGGTQIKLKGGLTNTYVRSTTTINANVARATHGETVQEILGSGDGSRPFQKFILKQPPLTYISAGTTSGAFSTLRVFVNDIEWREVPTLYGAKPDARVFISRLGDDGKTTVQFGDGINGARLPTGQENVRATYRRGLGLGGLLKADQLSLLMTRPAGVRGVTNPHPTAGGDDSERLEMIRENAPIRVMTLDRIVSLLDYQDFARAFAGVAKAYAVWEDVGRRRGVLITVAAPRGGTIDERSDTYRYLLDSIRNSADPHVPVRIKSYTKKTFRIDANVKIDPDYNEELVLTEIETILRNHFSFEERSFGQDVTPGEVYAAIQSVKGVVAVMLDAPQEMITADLPQDTTTILDPAVLLTLDPASIDLEIWR